MKKTKTELIFIGMGLSGFRSCSLETLDFFRRADIVFIENYTNFIQEEIPALLQQFKPKFSPIDRQNLEEHDHKFLESIDGKSTVILVPGDPFIATTHNSLRNLAIQKGIRCRTIHNASIISAAVSATGLSSYRFGRIVTCPFPQNASEFPYEIIKLNKTIKAHTLVLLDIQQTTGEFLSVNEAISILLDLEEKRKEKVLQKSNLLIGLAKIGYEEEVISAGNPEEVKKVPWRDIGPPQALIVCFEPLHFVEEETLRALWGVG